MITDEDRKVIEETANHYWWKTFWRGFVAGMTIATAIYVFAEILIWRKLP